MLKILYGFIIFFLTVFGGVYPLKKHASKIEQTPFDFRSAESLACGVFLGAGLLHMLGESAEKFHTYGYHYPIAFLLCGGVYLLFLLLEHIGKEYYHHHSHTKQNNNYFAYIAVLMMSIHSLLSGSALGLSDEVSVTAIIFFAIISHKAAESFAIAIQLVKSDMSKKVKIITFFIFALMTPLGILIGSVMVNSSAQLPNLLVPSFTALAAGTFLYLGTLHGLEKCVLVKQCCNLKYFSFVILGFAIMAVMALYV